jgi:hypothetical protein
VKEKITMATNGKRYVVQQRGAALFVVLDTETDAGGNWAIQSEHRTESTAKFNARARNAAEAENK